ncbi:hypothetical protein GGR56DRAFT_176766 [Xylariaceae sp. FL0804]|nr:hypothetical protein GGR56DRAFT_176766 [Xylariaceae sp. FL0804]
MKPSVDLKRGWESGRERRKIRRKKKLSCPQLCPQVHPAMIIINGVASAFPVRKWPSMPSGDSPGRPGTPPPTTTAVPYPPPGRRRQEASEPPAPAQAPRPSSPSPPPPPPPVPPLRRQLSTVRLRQIAHIRPRTEISTARNCLPSARAPEDPTPTLTAPRHGLGPPPRPALRRKGKEEREKEKKWKRKESVVTFNAAAVCVPLIRAPRRSPLFSSPSSSSFLPLLLICLISHRTFAGAGSVGKVSKPRQRRKEEETGGGVQCNYLKYLFTY